MTVEGRDVSHYDGASPSLAGLGFVIAKATQGLTVVDPMHDEHVQTAQAAKQVAGSYHFLTPGDGAGQCDYFLEHALPVAHLQHLFAVDVEVVTDQPFVHPDPPDLMTFHRRFHDRMPGRKLLVYSYASFWMEHFEGYLLNCPDCVMWTSWLRSANPPLYGGWQRVTIQQYQTVPYDRDRFNGTLAQLVGLASQSSKPGPTQHTGADMIEAIQNKATGETRFITMTPTGLRVFAAMSGDDLHLLNVLVAAGGAHINVISDGRAWATAVSKS